MEEIRKELNTLIGYANEKKQEASENQGSAVARRWAVFATEVEKTLAYYIAYLEPKESVE